MRSTTMEWRLPLMRRNVMKSATRKSASGTVTTTAQAARRSQQGVQPVPPERV